MNVLKPFTAPRKLLASFVLSAGVLLLAIGWLGWRLLSQERVLDDQRLHDQLENNASLATRDLERVLADWDQQLTKLGGGQPVAIPPQAVALVVGERGIVARSGVVLPFYPWVSPPVETSSALFADAESFEFERGNPAGAEAAYRRLAKSGDPSIRGSALMRLARVLRREHRLRDAVTIYGELLSSGPEVWVAGSPAELVARRERVSLFESLGDADSARAERQALSESLWGGRHVIDQPTFDFYRDGIVAPKGSGRLLSMASRLAGLAPAILRQQSGRVAIKDEDVSYLAVWKKTPEATAVVVGELQSMVPVLTTASLPGFAIVLQDEAGDSALDSDAASGSVSAVRTARQTGLPWTVRMIATDGGNTEQLVRSRRLLFLAGFLLVVLVVATAGVVLFRAVSHELNVARLQSEFVATVSHEFRSPLTAMRHLTEMLDEGEAAPSRIPQYYKALVKETRRLQSLVESLLDFGRMEAGRRTYRMEHRDAFEVVRQVLDEFSDSPAGRRIRLDDAQNGGPAPIRVDSEALRLAVRNLVDNALKYSSEDAPVRVFVESDPTAVTIAVNDSGPGIPASEQRDIFRKFVRGSAAADRSVKGTGIGLSIADHIVQAHGGALKLHSEFGRGSTFSIVIPVTEA